EAVTGVFHQPAAMIEDDRIDRAAMGLERGMRPRLVGAHQAGVTGDIGADNGGESSLHRLHARKSPPSGDRQQALCICKLFVSDGSWLEAIANRDDTPATVRP